ncbi:YihY/virulence factor BrkB family protein [Leucobacter sp. UCMA 4100]|uniref:YihY/virulence factor BrkB family protein n=1 Tax=Leucobacter sp. UCMA 4100 TaxID=2810534 RepID=UPI0022EB9CFF|nr:YihY/virulence factor BrkB family protein [Leucobacter sp. UCMA 4100]
MSAWRGFFAYVWKRIRFSHPYRAFSRFTDVGGPVLSAGMSFQAVFAVFAALWVGFGILALSTRGNTELINSISEIVNSYVPGLIETAEQKGQIKLDELLNQRTLTWGSAIAGVSLVWVSMAWFTSTRRSVRIIFGLEVKEYRNWLLLKLRDFFGAVGFFLAILISASLTVVSSSVFRHVLDFFDVSGDSWLAGTLGWVASYTLMFLLDVLIIMGIHMLLAEVKVASVWRLIEGSAYGSLALFGLKLLASLGFVSVGSNPLLASFAFFVALLLWFNLICRVILMTSAWIATGQDPEMGLPEGEVSPKRS